MVVLFDDSTKLQIGSIGVDVKRRVWIGIAKENIFGDERFHSFECTLTLRSSDKGNIFAGESGNGSKNIRTAAKHVTIEGDGTTESTNRSTIGRRSYVKDGFDLFAPWLGTRRSEPKAKEIGFGNSPLEFSGVDSKAVVQKACEDKTKAGKVIVPDAMCDFDVINGGNHIINAVEDFFHSGLSKIRGLTSSHGQTGVAELAKRRDDGAKLGRFGIKAKGVILHGNINLGEEFVWALILDDGLNLRQWILLVLDEFVEHAEIGDPAHGTVLFGNNDFGNDEGTGSPE